MRYRPNNRDIIAIEVPKGKKDAYKQAAWEMRLSLSMLIQNGVEEYIKNHASEIPFAIEKPMKLEETFTEAELQLSENFSKLPKNVQRKFAGLIKEFAKHTDKGRVII